MMLVKHAEKNPGPPPKEDGMDAIDIPSAEEGGQSRTMLGTASGLAPKCAEHPAVRVFQGAANRGPMGL